VCFICLHASKLYIASCLHASNIFLTLAHSQLHLHLVFTPWSSFSSSSYLHALMFIFTFILSSRPDLQFHLHLVSTLWTTFSYRWHALNLIFIFSLRPDLHLHLHLVFTPWSLSSSSSSSSSFFARFELHFPIVGMLPSSSLCCLHALIFILYSCPDLHFHFHLHLVCTVWTTPSYRLHAVNFSFILSSRPDLHLHLVFMPWSLSSSCLHALIVIFIFILSS